MNKGLKDNIQKAVKAIKKAERVFVFAHKNPDGDTIGCLLALGLAMLAIGTGAKQALLDQMSTEMARAA